MTTDKSVSRIRLFIGGSALYFTVYLHYGVTTPFLPVWYEHKGFSPDQIGALLSLPMFLKLLVIAPIMTFADRLRRVRDMTWLCTGTAALILASMNFVDPFVALLALTGLFAVFWDTMPVLADAYCVSAAKDKALDFGRMRLWGSIAFVSANLLSGLIVHRLGVGSTVWIAVACLSLPLLVLPRLPPDSAFNGARPSATGEWRKLLQNRGLLLMIASVSLIISSHGLLNNFSSSHWISQGLSETTVGQLWAVSVAAEGAVLFFGRTFIERRSPEMLVIIGGIAAVLRWLIMSRDPSLALLFPIQLLQGLSGISPILAMMIYIERNIPPHLIASAQGLYAPVWSAALALTTLASGPLWRLFGVQAYFAMTLIAATGAAIAAVAMRIPANGTKAETSIA
jgi:MFS transporter, PPP family, 3-phenylpropionic acid transporter